MWEGLLGADDLSHRKWSIYLVLSLPYDCVTVFLLLEPPENVLPVNLHRVQGRHHSPAALGPALYCHNRGDLSHRNVFWHE